MPWGRREPCRLALATAALLLGAACGGSPAGPPAAAPSTSTPPSSTSPPAVRTPAPTAQTSALATGELRRYVIGVIGDYGVDAAPVRQVVRAMTRFNAGRPLHAVVTTGDNAYCCGTTTQSQFAHRMLAPLRDRGARVYPALGNHDVGTEGGTAFMRVFGMSKRWYTANVGPVQFVVLDSTRVTSATQLTFLKNVLAAPRPGSFRVVVFHHPAWSCSAHKPNQDVIDRWLPLFGTNVDLVLTGHNHTYERFRASNGTRYLTTGGGGAGLYSSSSLACRGVGKMEYLKTRHHAVRMVATRTSLRVEGVAVDGTVFDTFTLAPR